MESPADYLSPLIQVSDRDADISIQSQSSRVSSNISYDDEAAPKVSTAQSTHTPVALEENEENFDFYHE
eukprot:CAMPEP_0197239028 /NCGR_PEP_ID=MMETSP1429-20130617/5528_1 /TAXON_ID=49237 /ORGANISM="Chaetoceros  sp., Strain UNC1202" /LENGTH=68 /DNA_ID=CAMNT_0042698339 /DNA_START=280 /DNA_END=483 /DNA_ORIENTATION=+